MMQLATTLEPTTQERGIVVIKNLQGYDLYTHFDRILAKAEMACFGDCFPAKLRAFHICAGSGKWVVELILPVMKQIAGKYIRLRTVCHTGSCADVLQELRRYHLVPESLSVVLGGAIQFHPPVQWVQQQEQQQEQGLVEDGDDDYEEFQQHTNTAAVETEEAGGGEGQGEDAALGVHDTDRIAALGETV
jgi:hypothetical protein